MGGDRCFYLAKTMVLCNMQQLKDAFLTLKSKIVGLDFVNKELFVGIPQGARLMVPLKIERIR